jgi:hypothetical protein
MLPAVFKPTILASEWPQTHALDHVTTRIDDLPPYLQVCFKTVHPPSLTVVKVISPFIVCIANLINNSQSELIL